MSELLHDHHHRDPPIPRPLAAAAFGLVAIALLAAIFVRFTGWGASEIPESPRVAQRELFFEDRPDGSVTVLDARDGRRVEQLEPGTNGFLRATLRSFARERRGRGLGAEAPFRIAVREDGRLTLEDPATDRVVYLDAFGPTNSAAFSRLLGVEAREHRARAIAGKP